MTMNNNNIIHNMTIINNNNYYYRDLAGHVSIDLIYFLTLCDDSAID